MKELRGLCFIDVFDALQCKVITLRGHSCDGASNTHERLSYRDIGLVFRLDYHWVVEQSNM